MVLNYMEVIVRNCIKNILSNDTAYADLYSDEHFVDDVMAKALNNLEPFYITTKKGEVYAEYSSLETQHQAEVIREVINALEFVSKNSNQKK